MLSGGLAAEGFYPAVEPLASSSILLDPLVVGQEHYEIAGRVRETLARAYFSSGRFAAAEDEFRAALDLDPVNDYAHFGVGLCRLRVGDRLTARRHLRLATAMRPDNDDYRAALAQTGIDDNPPARR